MSDRSDPLGLLATLREGDVVLRPLIEGDREALRAACAQDPAIWEIYAISYAPAQFDASFDRLLGNPARLPFAVEVADELVGMTAWIDPDPLRLSAEIGNTYLVPAHRGSSINGRMKRLLFAHGFARGLKRIQLCVDVRNQRSQAACRKVGATFEGVIRNHMVTWTGHERDTALFSVVERDRERLGL